MVNAVKLVLQNSLGVFVFPQMGGTPFGGLGAPNMEQMAAMGMPGPNMNPQVSSLTARRHNSSMLWQRMFFVVTSPSLLFLRLFLQIS